MANLSITLELDNRGYITGIRASEDAIKKFGQTSQTATDQAARGMNNAAARSNTLFESLGRLRTVLLGTAFVSFARGALLSAQELQGLSDATGVASIDLLKLRYALDDSGVGAENFNQVMLRFSDVVDQATERGNAMNKAFMDLGITEKELIQLALPDLFKRVVEELKRIGPEGGSAAKAMEFFGKRAGEMVPEEVLDNLKLTAEELEQITKEAIAIAEADATMKEFRKTVLELQGIFLQTFGPLISAIRYMLENMPAVNVLMKVFLATVVAIGVASGLRIFIGLLGRAWDGLKLLKRGLDAIRGRSASVPMDREGIIGGLAGLGGLGAGVAALGIDESAALNEIQQAVKAAQAQGQDLSQTQTSQSDRTMKDAANTAERLASRLDNLRDKVADIAKNFNQYSKELNDNLRIQEKHLSMSENQIEIDKAVADVRKEAARSIADYQTMLDGLKKDEMGLAPIIKQQIENIKLRAQADETSVRLSTQKIQEYKESLEQLADAQELTNLRLGNEESLQQLQDEINLVGLYGDALEDQQALLEVTQELRGKLLGIQQEENNLILKKDQLGAEAFQREMARLKALREEAYVYAEERLKLEEELIAKQRELSQDWQKELSKQLEDLANSISPAKLAANMFGSVISSIDSALTQFVEKGKFSFKDFARSLLRDMALIIARAAIMRAILAAFGMAGFGPLASAGASSTMAFNYTGPQFGGFAANGGRVTPNKAYMVGERGPELFVPKAIGNIVPNNQLGMAAPSQTQVNYHISAVDAQSFRSLVARDPAFLYNVTEVGRRSNPARRLA